MDSLDLIAKESEFKKLNQQIEKKSEILLKEIEHVMQKQDFFSELSQNLNSTLSRNLSKNHHLCVQPKGTSESTNEQDKLTPTRFPSKNNLKSNIKSNHSQCSNEMKTNESCSTIPDKDKIYCTNDSEYCTKRVVCDCCTKSRTVDDDFNFLHAFVSMNVQENVLPKSFLKDRITVEGVCKFLSSKVKLMQDQIDKLQSTIEKKAAQCEKHLAYQAELESERMALLNRANSLRADMADVRAKSLAVQNRLNEKDRLYKEQRSETDKLTSEVNRLRSKNCSVEARAASQGELIDGLRQQLEVLKRTEKEFRDTSRSVSLSHQNAISQLEARVKTLTSCIEKQNALIDNLRAQNGLLCASAVLRVSEQEFNDFLKQDF